MPEAKMKAFAVKCPVPEVFDAIVAIAKKNGYQWTSYINEIGRSRENLYLKTGLGSCSDAAYDPACHGERISIETFIAELTKPREPKLFIGPYEVTFNADRSILVGCQKVDAATCDEIDRRRKAVK